jgi:hypothetical protein
VAEVNYLIISELRFFSKKNIISLKKLSFVNPESGANPTIASYNASVVNFYNATHSLARFENTNIIF